MFARLLTLFVACLVLAGCIGGVGRTASRDLRVMGVNVRVAVAADGVNAWPNRRDLLAATIRQARPDVIGMQELTGAQAADLAARLPEFAWFGRDRRGGTTDEHMGVFYRKAALRLTESGDFWLSDTPDVPGSVSWGHPYPRMVTWGRFTGPDGRVFHLFNTHFPYRTEDESARTRGAQALAARIAALSADAAVVVTGDFNTGPDSMAYRVLTGALPDMRVPAVARGPEGTFHGFTGVAERRIDWILARGYGARSFATIDAHRGALYPSDHFPLLAVLRRSRAEP